MNKFVRRIPLMSWILFIVYMGCCLAGIGNSKTIGDFWVGAIACAVPFLIPAIVLAIEENRIQNMETNGAVSDKSKSTVLLLAIFLGVMGVHRFFVGRKASGTVYLLTCGCFCVGWIIDIVFIIKNQFVDSNHAIISDNVTSNSHTASYSTEKVASDRYISPCFIAAIPCAIIASIGAIVLLTGATDDPAEAFYPLIVFGIAAIVLFIVSLKAPKTKTEAAVQKAAKEHAKKMLAYDGVYLSEEQIFDLESSKKLPIVSVPMFLQMDEVAVYYCRAARQETKNRVVGVSGSYGGGTARIAKGFSVHTGSSSSTPIYGDVYFNYDGEFVITNRRVVFLSDNKGFELSHNNITAATAYADGFAFQSKNSSYVILLPCAHLARIAFDGVRTGEIPYANDDEYEYDEPIEVTENNISSVDEMDGHEFEYFCADVLKKNGFADVSVTKGSGDQGVDILANRGGVKYAIQCKHYSSPLGNKPIQEVNAGKTFYNCHVGVVMTNSTFTTGALALAEATGVLLWDNTELQRMINNANM